MLLQLLLAREDRPSYWISCIIAGTKRMPTGELESPSIAGYHQDLIGGVWSYRIVKFTLYEICSACPDQQVAKLV